MSARRFILPSKTLSFDPVAEIMGAYGGLWGLMGAYGGLWGLAPPKSAMSSENLDIRRIIDNRLNFSV